MAPLYQSMASVFLKWHSKHVPLLWMQLQVCNNCSKKKSCRSRKSTPCGIISHAFSFFIFSVFWHFRSTFILRRMLQTLAYWRSLVTAVISLTVYQCAGLTRIHRLRSQRNLIPPPVDSMKETRTQNREVVIHPNVRKSRRGSQFMGFYEKNDSQLMKNGKWPKVRTRDNVFAER